MVRKYAVIIFAGLLLYTVTLGGCGGGGAKVTSSSTTLGQELMDLQQAHEKGVITEKEYNSMRKKIIRKYE